MEVHDVVPSLDHMCCMCNALRASIRSARDSPGMHASPGNSLIGGVSTTYGAKHRVMARDFFSALCIPSLTAYSAGVCMLPGY